MDGQKEEGSSSGGNKDADRQAYVMHIITVSMKDRQCETAQKYPWITVGCYPNLPEDGSSPPEWTLASSFASFTPFSNFDRPIALLWLKTFNGSPLVSA